MVLNVCQPELKYRFVFVSLRLLHGAGAVKEIDVNDIGLFLPLLSDPQELAIVNVFHFRDYIELVELQVFKTRPLKLFRQVYLVFYLILASHIVYLV